MEKGILLTNWDCTRKANGIANKINAELLALNQWFNMTLISQVLDDSICGKIYRRLPFTRSSNNWICDERFRECDLLYIRKGEFDLNFLRFLKKFKVMNPHSKVLVEIPTYPYDREYLWKDIPFLVKDIFVRNKLSKYIDRYVTYSKDIGIFKVKTINIVNGIEIKESDKVIWREYCKDLHMIGVANLMWWHGYDRMIRGIKNYYEGAPRRKVYFHIVGDGDEKARLKKYVKRYKLSEYIIFHGPLFEDKLEDIYRKCNMAVASLGGHRKNLFLSSELKSREYLLKALPIIHSAAIDLFEQDEFPYHYKVEEDDSPINIEKILECYDLFYRSDKMANEIFDYALKNCDIKRTMKPVFNYYLEYK